MSSTVSQQTRPGYKTQWIFHHPKILLTGHANAAVRSYYQYTDVKVTAAMRCAISGDSAYCAAEGLYGSMEVTSEANLPLFLDYITGSLASEGVHRLSVTLFPEPYDKVLWQSLRNLMEMNGFRKEGVINHRLIAVTAEEDEPLASGDWRSQDTSLSDFSVTQEPLYQFDRINQLIQHSAVEDGTNGGARLVADCLHHFQEDTLLFTVREGAKFVALGVFLQAGPGMLYTLHLSQLDEYNSYEPLRTLFQFVYEWAELRDYRYIDLGQIGMNLQEDVGLIQAPGEHWVKSW